MEEGGYCLRLPPLVVALSRHQEKLLQPRIDSDEEDGDIASTEGSNNTESIFLHFIKNNKHRFKLRIICASATIATHPSSLSLVFMGRILLLEL